MKMKMKMRRGEGGKGVQEGKGERGSLVGLDWTGFS